MYKRILTIQDISCVGQCSLTVALPILSACGAETCILPSAVLSSHTGGFKSPYYRDLSEDMPRMAEKWKNEGISFDAIYTGYLGSIRQIELVKEISAELLAPEGKLIVDPAMADHGKFYSGFDERYAEEMKKLCQQADLIIPNLTEACMMTGQPYREDYDRQWIEALAQELRSQKMKQIVLTGVGFEAGQTGIYTDGAYYAHEKIGTSYHGTGDIFASAFVGAWMQEKTVPEAVRIAADFTLESIRNTFENPAHWYGVKFETALPLLMKRLQGEN